MTGGGSPTWGVLTHVATGPFALTVDLLTAGAVIAYLAGVRRLSAQGHHWRFWRTEAFVAGAAGIWISVGSGLAPYSMRYVTLQIVRHLILMMTVPALLSLGRPLMLLRRAGPPAIRRLLDAAGKGPLIAAAANPMVAWLAYLASMYLMLTDRGFIRYTMSHPVARDVSTTSMVAIGLLYWGALVASGDGSRGMSYPARMVSILANMPFEVLAGIWLRYQMRPVDPMASLSDTRAAGESFIVGATIVSTFWLIAVVAQWLSEAVRESRSHAEVAETGTGWTVPWWVQAEPDGAPLPARGHPAAGRPSQAPGRTELVRNDRGSSLRTSSPDPPPRTS